MSVATHVSADGKVVVGQSTNSQVTQVFRWTKSSGMVALSVPPGSKNNYATHVSADGSVIIGQTANSQVSQVFRWTQ